MSTLSWIKIASFMMALLVMIGAFGAHGLRGKLTPEMMTVFKTGVFYHAIHGLALFVVAWLLSLYPDKKIIYAGCLFVLGICLFSGSLYALAVTGIKKLGMITPFGGLSFILGWCILFFVRK